MKPGLLLPHSDAEELTWEWTFPASYSYVRRVQNLFKIHETIACGVQVNKPKRGLVLVTWIPHWARHAVSVFVPIDEPRIVLIQALENMASRKPRQ